MPTYTVTQVGDQIREWVGKPGPMKSYRVTLRNAQNEQLPNVEWARKETSPPPQVGQTINATIDMRKDTTYGPKLTLEQSAGGGGGGAGRSMSPEERRGEAMARSQIRAIEALTLAGTHGEYRPPSANDVVHQIMALAKLLYDQIQQAEGGS